MEPYVAALLAVSLHASRALFLHLVWVLFAAAFVGLGLHAEWTEPRIQIAVAKSPLAASQSFMAAALGSPETARVLLQVCAVLPKGELIACAQDGDSNGPLLYQNLSYLAWPRPVRFLGITRQNAAESLRKARAAKAAAIFFYRVPSPPGMSNGLQIGKQLTVFQER